MGSNSANSQKSASSVEILKAHMDEMSVRNLDDDWINETKINLSSLMEDRHTRIVSEKLVRDFEG
ncbi:hypothetical protein [Methanolobus psychrotolerans]|uniref:hypothetical protein n=1 Tax=Methanolobus psychrotolerans TaxID=1874706 RepID=UPI000B91563E|nr:hypothetical protein [Methanolobus psychrotolerans]